MLISATLFCLALGSGCVSDGQPALFPNPDPNLRKTSAELAADAAKRAYESDAARGGQAAARAQYELMDHRFDLVNLSDMDWANVEVWINQKFVVFVPEMQKGVDKRLDFEMFFDKDGHHFATDGGKNPVQNLEIYRDGKIFTVPATLE
ncbi:MAG: hypothetical protein M3O30_05985 [Planctomycetota bacterium]|nr:hypothetical protein [Planctomycetota bacterium]